MSRSHRNLVALALAIGLSGGWSPLARAYAVCARKSKVTLYSRPSLHAAKSWVVAKYMPFVRVERKGAWLHLKDLDGDLHWGRTKDFTHKIRCVVVKASKADLRQGPSRRSPLASGLKTLDRYTPLERLDSESGWIEVRDGLGQKAWISEGDLWQPVVFQSLRF